MKYVIYVQTKDGDLGYLQNNFNPSATYTGKNLGDFLSMEIDEDTFVTLSFRGAVARMNSLLNGSVSKNQVEYAEIMQYDEDEDEVSVIEDDEDEPSSLEDKKLSDNF